MNSFPFQVSEWMAPASRFVVVMTMSDGPALARITASPLGGFPSARAAATEMQQSRIGRTRRIMVSQSPSETEE